MKKHKSFFLLSVFILSLAISSHGTHKHGKHREGRDDYNSSTTSPPHSRVFDVFSFGAVGDGVSDDSKALKAAWRAACAIPGATIKIPSDFKFLIRPVTLHGPCMPHLVLQIDGTLLAPSSPASWSKSDLYQWINLKWLSNFTIQGSGSLDGQGSEWWSLFQAPQTKKETNHFMSEMTPTTVRFYKSYNIMVCDIYIMNSPQCHLKFDSSWSIMVKNITISSPQDSPNTDGIHLQNTRDVEIKHSNIGSGDDCVSIQTGCSNVHIHHIGCSPSHGISLGGLGKGNSLACISNVSIHSITVQNALSGVRIKTWQGGIGSVRNVTFSNIQVSDVEIPIVIDQYYCNKRSCKNKTDAVAISGITYRGITGTYSYQPMQLACSDSYPCADVNLIDVHLLPEYKSSGLREAFCWNSYGEAQGPLQPSSISCLQRTHKPIRALTKAYNYTC